VALLEVEMMKDKKPQHLKRNVTKPVRLVAPDISHVGLGEIAYVRHIVTDGHDAYGIFAADGQPLGYMNDRDSAMAATVQNHLVPHSVH